MDFKQMVLAHRGDETRLCIFPFGVLTFWTKFFKTQRNATNRIELNYIMIFTPDQCRTLASINWALFLSQHKLESLDLDFVDLSSEALVIAKVRCLTLGSDYRFGDKGAALLESALVRKGFAFSAIHLTHQNG
jgi:hypothetical protein